MITSVDHLPALKEGVICSSADLVWDLITLLEENVFDGGVVNARFEGVRGGSAANVAENIAFAGGTARFVGQIGEDAIGTQMADGLFKRGVEVRGVHRGRSAQLISLVQPNGDRSFIVDTGDQTQLFPDDINDGWLEGAALLNISGYAFARPQIGQTMQALATRAHELGIKVTLDPGSPNLILDSPVENYLIRLAQTKPDVLFVNEDEALALKIDIHSDHPESTLPEGVGLAVIHQGAKPTIALTQDDWLEVPCETVSNIVDTTGAGDAFAAGFLVAWQSGNNITECIVAGHHLAGKVIQVPGASLFAR